MNLADSVKRCLSAMITGELEPSGNTYIVEQCAVCGKSKPCAYVIHNSENACERKPGCVA